MDRRSFLAASAALASSLDQHVDPQEFAPTLSSRMNDVATKAGFAIMLQVAKPVIFWAYMREWIKDIDDSSVYIGIDLATILTASVRGRSMLVTSSIPVAPRDEPERKVWSKMCSTLRASLQKDGLKLRYGILSLPQPAFKPKADSVDAEMVHSWREGAATAKEFLS